MTEKEYKEHIQYTHNAYCRIVIRHASIDAARMLFAKWKREISLEYLTEEKFVPLSTTDEYFQVPDYGETYPFSVRGDRYAGYIRYFSKMNGYYNSDMEDYIRTKLIESLFKFRFDR